jgi:putative membrane protein
VPSSLVDELPLVLVAAALVLHLEGERRATRLRGGSRGKLGQRRAWLFYAGLATIVIALAGPIDTLSQKLFWVHMTQHVLLLTVAAPLIVLGAPWMSIWRPLPLSWRRRTARTVARSPSLRPLRVAAGALGRPLHALEHVTFLLVGILLWAQVLASPPLRLRLDPLRRVCYIVAAAVVGWVISLVLAFAPRPLYPFYAHVAHRPGGISALVDQQLAAGVMLVPGSLTMTLFVFIGLYRWLGQDEDERGLRRPPATGADRVVG